MVNPQVQILLSTYNGSSYLREQLESILNQSFTDWQLLIRDDGSKDETVNIINEFSLAHPKQIIIISGGKGGNASYSFMSLLSYAESPYIMFCDQDDVWKADKVQKAFDEIKALEKKHPIALHFTDMAVVDEYLNELYPSFFNQQKLNPQWCTNKYFSFAQSIAAGCTMIFTSDLVKKLHPIKAPLFQHDHWLAMHAAYYGVVNYSLDKTLLYRQHGANAVGSHEIDSSYFLAKISALQDIWNRWKYIRKCFGQQVSVLELMKAKWKLNKQRV